MHRARFGAGPHEVTLLQALGQQAYAIATPPQHLDAIALAAPEDKHMATEGILLKRRLNSGRQTIEPPTHIRGARSQPHPRADRQPDHCNDSMSVRNRLAEHRPSSTIVPLARRTCMHPNSGESLHVMSGGAVSSDSWAATWAGAEATGASLVVAGSLGGAGGRD